MTTRTSKLTGTAASAWLAVWYTPAVAQATLPLQNTLQTICDGREAQPDDSSPAEGASSLPKYLCEAIPTPIQSALVLPATVVLPTASALAQDFLNPAEERRPVHERPLSYGVEIEFASGHSDRGFVISDSPVVKAATWVSGSVVEFSVWSNFTLAEATEDSRPRIVDLELTRAHKWRNFTIAPAARMYFYRDVLSSASSRSIEGWFYLSYDAGPFRLFSNQSVDLLASAGGYFGDAGIAIDRRLSPAINVEGSFKTGWASSTFNDAWADVDKSALNLVGVDGSLTDHNAVASGDERHGVVITSDEFERSRKSPGHLKQRLTTEAKPKLREVDFGVVVKQVEDLRTTLIGEPEIVVGRLDPLVVSVRVHALSPGLLEPATDPGPHWPRTACKRGNSRAALPPSMSTRSPSFSAALYVLRNRRSIVRC